MRTLVAVVAVIVNRSRLPCSDGAGQLSAGQRLMVTMGGPAGDQQKTFGCSVFLERVQAGTSGGGPTRRHLNLPHRQASLITQIETRSVSGVFEFRGQDLASLARAPLGC